MSASVLFRLGPDPVLTDVMAAFVDLNRRPVQGQITVEELLLHLLAQPDAHALCATFKVNASLLGADADQALLDVLAHRNELPEAADGYLLPPPIGEFPQRTEEFEQVVLAAITQAQARPASAVGVVDFLAAICHLSPVHSPASRVLHDHGLTARLLTAHAMRQEGHNPYAPRTATGASTAVVEPGADPHRERFLYDLSVETTPWLDRQNLVEEGLRLLASARQAPLLLMGPATSGKETLAVELARRLTHGPRPAGLEQTRILGLDLDALVAGCQLRGQLEDRLRKYVLEVIEHKRVARDSIVLWLGDLGHVLTYARKDLDVLLALRLAMRRGYVRLMGSATPEQFKRLQDHDPELAARFVSLQVRPPSAQETHAIALHHAQEYADHHQVNYSAELLHRAQALVQRYVPHRPLVQALLQVLDETGAHALQRQATTASDADVEVAVARLAQVDPSVIHTGNGAQVDRTEQHLRAHLVGQDHAIDLLVDTLRLSAAGLGEGGRTRPVGSFFFMGPTGVGKTEMANRLAEGMGVPMVRLDMSEYAEPHSVARLIGAPPGYLGHQEVPVLARALDQSPRSVILVDEVEKGAREVHRLFLQILSNGILTDGKGQAMDFRQCMLVFTSNIGTEEAARRSIGFLREATESDQRREAALAQGFPPEFRNRFDHIIPFRALTPEDMTGVVDRHLTRLAGQVREQGHAVRFTTALRSHLAQAGYDPQMGARPLHRLVAREVSTRLARELLRARKPVQLTVGFRQGKIQIRVDGSDPA